MYKLRKLFVLFLTSFLILSCTPVVFASQDRTSGLTSVDDILDNTDASEADESYDITDPDSATTEMLLQMFSNDLYNNKAGLAAGMQLSQPIVYLIFVGCIFLVIIVSYLFIGVTAVDLAYIIVPPLRGMLYKRKQAHGDSEDGGFILISDSCVNAVHGSGKSSGGSMGMGPMQSGGGSDRGVGSSLIRYASDRTKEFAVFLLFVIFFISGMLGRIVIILFKLFAGLFNGVANLI